MNKNRMIAAGLLVVALILCVALPFASLDTSNSYAKAMRSVVTLEDSYTLAGYASLLEAMGKMVKQDTDAPIYTAANIMIIVLGLASTALATVGAKFKKLGTAVMVMFALSCTSAMSLAAITNSAAGGTFLSPTPFCYIALVLAIAAIVLVSMASKAESALKADTETADV